MSMPKIPDLNLNIERKDAVNILIMSIALEELALAHILNVEGEKVQYVLGTLEGRDPGEITICDVLEINRSLERTLKNVIKTEMLLNFKLETALSLDQSREEPPDEVVKP